MNAKEQAIKNILMNILGNGSKKLCLKGSITFDVDVSFKEDIDGNVNIDVKHNNDDITIDSSRELEDGAPVVPRKTKSNGPGWDSVEI